MSNMFKRLNDSDRSSIKNSIDMSKQMIWNFYSRKYGIQYEDFECNELCVKYLEDYLAVRIRPRILKWKWDGKNILITRVKTLSGIVSKDPKKIQETLNLVSACAVLLGQCIATLFDGEWKVDPNENICIEVSGGPVYLYWKCLKFVTLGDEDSLVGFIQNIRHLKANKLIVDQVLESLQIDRTQYEKVETWTDKEGRIEKIVIKNENREIVETVWVGIMKTED